MEKQISKTEFKAHALELMREIEASGNELIITTHGKPQLVIQKYAPKTQNPLQQLGVLGIFRPKRTHSFVSC